MYEYMKKVAAILPVLAVLGAAGVYSADGRYIRLQQLAEFAREQRIEDLSDKIDNLTIKVNLSQATEYDRARLENLKRKLERTLNERGK